MKSLSNTSKNMAMEVGEPSPSLQVLTYKPTSLSLSRKGFFHFLFSWQVLTDVARAVG
jgi:hypothetical protein